MRIISGKYRGLKLAEFDGSDVRPTADRVKESLFNVLFAELSAQGYLICFAVAAIWVSNVCRAEQKSFISTIFLPQASTG